MEKTIYEIKYNDWFHLQMTSEREPMEEMEFDKAAFEAVLADMVFRARGRSGAAEDTEETIFRWMLHQIGLAIQSTDLTLPAGTESDPLDTVSHAISLLKERSS